MTVFSLLHLAPLLLAAGGQQAAPTTPAPDNSQKVVCRRDAVLGSRLPGPRVCKTKAEWAANDRQAQDQVRKIQDMRQLPTP